MEPEKAGVNFLHNDSSQADALQRPPSTTYTGKSDTDKVLRSLEKFSDSQIMWYTVFEGITNYTNFPKVIQVAGTTEDGKIY